MRDPVFVGRDLAEALATAGQTLGMAAESLRYVVIDGPGRAAGTPEVRIAILMERGQAPAPARPEPLASGPDAVRLTLEALAEATGLELTAELVEGEETVEVRLTGPGAHALLDDGEDTVRALDHLLRKTLQLGGDERRFVLACGGKREFRETALRERARVLAEAVLADGRTRETEPLNAYERRIVHLALSEVAGIRTAGVGSGGERRVAIAPSEAAPGDEGR